MSGNKTLAALMCSLLVLVGVLGVFWLEKNAGMTETTTVTTVSNITTTVTQYVTTTIKEKQVITTTVPTTTTLTVTEEKTKTVTKTLAATLTETTTIVLGLREKEVGFWTPPPSCKDIDRRTVDEKIIACALSQWTALQKIAWNLRVPGDPMETAVRIGSWVAKHIEYADDRVLFNTEQYTQLPLETLNRKAGDCEDLSLLTATLLLGTREYDEVVIACVDYSNIRIGHVEAGFVVNGTVYLIPWMNSTYPMSLQDYCCMEKRHDAIIDNITLYAFGLEGGCPVLVWKKTFHPQPSCPPPIISGEHLLALKSSVESMLEKIGFNTQSPPSYALELAGYIASYEPRTPPPLIPICYYTLVIPVDWFGNKTPSWVAWRCSHVVEDNIPELLSWLLEDYRGSLMVYVENDTGVIRDYRYDENGNLVPVEREEPVIVLYLLLPQSYPVPESSVSVVNGILRVWVNATEGNRISVLIYDRAGNPVLGIAKPGWVYEGITTVNADRWETTSNGTIIEIEYCKVKNRLPPGHYELDVWLGNSIVYTKVIIVEEQVQ